ncbi:hypothetical protein ABK040_008591 [Willaertia magna]
MFRFIQESISDKLIDKFQIEKPNEKQKVLSSSRDFLRKLHSTLKTNTGHLPPNFSLYEAIVCVEIACKKLEIPFARELAVQLTGNNAKEYQQAFQEVINLLNITFPVKFSELCVKFGCHGIQGTCEKLLAQYEENFKKNNPKIDLTKIDFTRPIFRVVTFYLTALHCKLKIDKKQLISESKVNERQFSDILESVKSNCNLASLLKDDKKKNKKEGEKENNKNTKKKKK